MLQNVETAYKKCSLDFCTCFNQLLGKESDLNIGLHLAGASPSIGIMILTLNLMSLYIGCDEGSKTSYLDGHHGQCNLRCLLVD